MRLVSATARLHSNNKNHRNRHEKERKENYDLHNNKMSIHLRLVPFVLFKLSSLISFPFAIRSHRLNFKGISVINSPCKLQALGASGTLR